MERKHPNPSESVERILERLTLLLTNKKPRLSQNEVIREIKKTVDILYNDLDNEISQLEDMYRMLDNVLSAVHNIEYQEKHEKYYQKRKPSR